MKLKPIVAAMACLALAACLLTAHAPAYAAGGDGSLAAAKITAQATAKKKARNPLAVRVTKLGINGKSLKSKAKTVKVLTVSNAKGKKSFKVAKWTTKKAKRYFKLNKKTGKVTVKRGTPTGTYKFKVKVTAAGNKSYKAGSKTVTVKIMVKNRRWVPEQGHYETVVVEAAWDEPVYERHAVCSTCGLDFTATGINAADHIDECGGFATSAQVQVGSIHHPAVTKRQWVVDTKGHWE